MEKGLSEFEAYSGARYCPELSQARVVLASLSKTHGEAQCPK